MNCLSRAREVFDVEIAALKAVRARLGPSFTQAAKILVQTLSTRGKVVVAGVGKSGNVGRKISATLTSTGSTSVVMDPVDAMHGDLGMICDGDAILMLSYSGNSEELINLIPAIRRFSVKIIALTGAPRSLLARHSDCLLDVRIPREACPFNLAPTASTTAMLAMGDALAMAVMEARGFRAQNFAKHHPSGAIGRALLLKVKDIMRGGERNPVASTELTVKQALLAMTKAKCGCVSVVDERGRLVGVFTDGDFRRAMATDESVLARKIAAVMSPNPICIPQDSLAVEALKIFNERNIDDLIVVDSRKRPVGLVDSQDLPRLKLM